MQRATQHARSTRGQAAARACAAVLCLGALSAPAAGREGVRERVDALLARSCAAGPEQWPALARELAGLGAEAVAPCLERLLALCAQEAGTAREVQAQVLLQALAGLPQGALCDGLRGLAAAQPTDCARRIGLRLLEQAGRAEDVLLATRLASPASESEAVDPGLRLAYARALAALAARQPPSASAFAAACDEAHPALVATLIRSLGERRDRDGASALARPLGRREEIDALLLIEIGRLAAVAQPADWDGEVLERVRGCLDARRREVVLEAAVALARLGDTASVPRLAGLLAEAREGEAGIFERALIELCGADHGPGPDAWGAWLESEQRWWWDEAPALLAALSSTDPAAVAPALKELAQHPLQRDEIAARLHVALRRPEPELAALACAVAARLGSPRSLPDLVELADAPDPRLRREARAALARLRPSEPRSVPDAPSPTSSP